MSNSFQLQWGAMSCLHHIALVCEQLVRTANKDWFGQISPTKKLGILVILCIRSAQSERWEAVQGEGLCFLHHMLSNVSVVERERWQGSAVGREKYCEVQANCSFNYCARVANRIPLLFTYIHRSDWLMYQHAPQRTSKFIEWSHLT